MRVGATVLLHGLVARPELNGVRGTVVRAADPTSGRVDVRLNGAGNAIVSLKLSNVTDVWFDVLPIDLFHYMIKFMYVPTYSSLLGAYPPLRAVLPVQVIDCDLVRFSPSPLSQSWLELHRDGDGMERAVRLKKPDGEMLVFEGPQGMERKVSASRSNGVQLFYEGSAGEERRVRVVEPNGLVVFYQGAQGAEREVRHEVPISQAFNSGLVVYFQGARGEERKVRSVSSDGHVCYYSGERGEERIVRWEMMGEDEEVSDAILQVLRDDDEDDDEGDEDDEDAGSESELDGPDAVLADHIRMMELMQLGRELAHVSSARQIAAVSQRMRNQLAHE